MLPKRPIETSAVVQKVGGVARSLVLPFEGSKEVLCQCSPFRISTDWYVGELTSKQLCHVEQSYYAKYERFTQLSSQHSNDTDSVCVRKQSDS